MKHFTKLDSQVDAIRWTGGNLDEVLQVVGPGLAPNTFVPSPMGLFSPRESESVLHVSYEGHTHRFQPGEWLVVLDGRPLRYTDQEFAASYAAIEGVAAHSIS